MFTFKRISPAEVLYQTDDSMELLTQSKGTLFSFMHSHPACEPLSPLSSPNLLTFCQGKGQVQSLPSADFVKVMDFLCTARSNYTNCQTSLSTDITILPKCFPSTTSSGPILVKCRLLHKTKSIARADYNHHAPSADLHAGSMFACYSTPATPTTPTLTQIPSTRCQSSFKT